MDKRVWSFVRCFLCGTSADHALEFTLCGTPAVMGACERHYDAVKAAARQAGMKIAEADALVPKGVG